MKTLFEVLVVCNSELLSNAEKVVEDFNDMTIAELKELGESEGISFKGCKNKSDYIARIVKNEEIEESAEDETDDDDVPEFDPLVEA